MDNSGRSSRFTGHVDDMAVYAFDGHTDSVYCAAIHPFVKGIIITGIHIDLYDVKLNA